MYILLTAATSFEIDPIFDYLEKNEFQLGGNEIGIQVTGIGSMMSTYELTKAAIQLRPDYIVQAGIAGSFNPRLPLSEVVLVKDEIMGDLGASEKDTFSDIFDLKLMDVSAFPYNNKRLINPLLEGKSNHYNLKLVSAVTVNEITTNNERIQLLKEKYNVDIESMEGAALHYICLKNKIPFLQVRSISNMVGERDKSKWKMKESVAVLNKTLLTLLPQLA